MARTTVLLLALLVGVASAARFAQDVGTGGAGLSTVERILERLRTPTNRKDDERDEKAYLVTKFKVPPSNNKDFVKAWLKLDDKTAKDKDSGVVQFDLKKPIGDNTIYTSYAEFETYEDLAYHTEQDYTRDFIHYTADKGITWELLPLKNVTGDSEEGRALQNGKAKTHGLAHVLVTYYVPAKLHGEFMEQWRDVAAQTLQEEGSHIYGLRKLATDNTVYYGYGTWESMEDVADHLKSKHVGKFLDYVDNKDIVWFLSPLKKLGKDEE